MTESGLALDRGLAGVAAQLKVMEHEEWVDVSMLQRHLSPAHQCQSTGC